jgi:hypothetical protein
LRGNRLYGGVLGAVVRFIEQRLEALFLLFVLGEIHERGKMLDHIGAAETNIQIPFGAARERGLDLCPRLMIKGRATRKSKLGASTSSRSQPAKDRKLSLAKMSGWLGSFASVNTIAMRVV